ncbi:MAG: hypothetical protein Q8L28_01100 [bacterium]|nr:hypothetical protein [bacterium]
MEFRYKPLEVKPSKSVNRKMVVWRPIIPVYLFNNKKVIGYEAIIDSGADFNIFHSEIADILGLNYKKGKKRHLFGLGYQEIKGYECEATIKIQGFGKYTAQIVFSSQIPPNSFAVLGNKGFFDHYSVNFKYNQRIIIINPALKNLN